jgi:hypothetical protein
MSEIPDDIRDAAEKAFYAVSVFDWSSGKDLFAKAIFAERKRCAKIADELFYPDETKISARIRDAILSTPSASERK